MKTSIKQFELFKEECRKWIKFFGLIEYRIEFFHGGIRQARAQTEDYDHMMACDITFAKELDDTTDNEKIKMAAFHEVCEIMLMRLRSLADEYYSFGIVNREVHSIVRRLENCIFKAR